MKKGFLITSVIVVSLCILLAGCGKSKDENEKKKEDEWFSYGLTIYNNMIDNTTIKFLKAAGEYGEADLDPVSLLGSQVVAGTNYMFLCTVRQEKRSGELLDSADLRVAILYVDLEGNATITQNTKFDVTKYALKDVKEKVQEQVGGWTVNSKFVNNISNDTSADEMIQRVTENIDGVSYQPLVLLASKKINNDEYYHAYLVLQKTMTAEPTYSLRVLTIDAKTEDYTLLSNSYVDLADFNK